MNTKAITFNLTPSPQLTPWFGIRLKVKNLQPIDGKTTLSVVKTLAIE